MQSPASYLTGLGWIGLAAAVALSCGSCSTAKEQARQSAATPVVEAQDSRVRIVLGGDAIFGRWHEDQWTAYHRAETLRAFGERTRSEDLTIVNLESALCETDLARKHPIRDKHIQLTAPPGAAKKLAAADVDVATIANNHALDCGPESVSSTTNGLDRAGVDARGIRGDETEFIDVGDGQIAVVAATVVPPSADPSNPKIRFVPPDDFDTFVEEIEALRTSHPDILLVVSLHWGAEMRDRPSSWQRARAQELIDAGADVIHGHGSHVFQTITNKDGATVAYGTGNLHFDMRNRSTLRRAVVVVECELGEERECTGEVRDFETTLAEARDQFASPR